MKVLFFLICLITLASASILCDGPKPVPYDGPKLDALKDENSVEDYVLKCYDNEGYC